MMHYRSLSSMSGRTVRRRDRSGDLEMVGKHQRLTVVHAEVTVEAEEGRDDLATCTRA